MIEKIKKNYFLLIGTFLFLYFFFNLLDGERGLISLIKKEHLLSQIKNDEKKLYENIKNLEFKKSLLSHNIDIYYVEMLIRDIFLFSKKNKKIYILKKNEKSN